ncbi:hypothetical protein MBM09_11635 [Flaviramulus sp. BrNp1-15]|uniref:hypothetical protein n=1 Tax=Flaviramulus sp. BrNp1-15 TaxID=2916754 RepID=UPI001EE84407|nr:hypothetical protein [Flaviramulus sp. BrNp1-15]ULC58570.1 hypothetical protein MBM09_11635 [Flaviramulus sp. BrNp1-15]
MKRILTLGLFLFLTLKSFAQTDGISYQAVIIGPDVLELPGVDSEGNYLPSTTVDIRFTIFDSGNQIEFQEVQTTTTDEFGRINLIIGAVEHDDFEKISWDGTSKDLKVDIDFRNGNSFVDMSREVLTFVPYAYHRNITATGTLDVDDDTFLNRELTVNGQTNLNGRLLVNNGNESNLSGDLTVDGETKLNNILNVNNKSTTYLTGALIVGDSLIGPPDGDLDAPTILNGSLSVVGESIFTGLTVQDLTVNNSALLEGDVDIDTEQQVTITSTVHTDPINYTTDAPYEQIVDSEENPGEYIENYPLLVQGSTQGIAIKVNGYGRNGNNYVSFWDDGAFAYPTLHGRIEGEIPDEFGNNADYLFDQSSLDYDILDANLDLTWASIDIAIEAADLAATYTDFRPCLGFGACTTGPGFSDIAASILSVALVAVKEYAAIQARNRAYDNRDTYDANKIEYQGVTYASGAGDYAEYLLRENIKEKMTYGDLVGVKGGKISKNLIGAERIMVVSLKPIVLGNMPQSNRENEYEKVAFMGQVPVKVFGQVKIGDYIIPSGKNDGIGIAVHPSKIKSNQIPSIVGTAWSESNNISGFNLVNTAVGVNRNDNNVIVQNLEKQIEEQAQEISDLKKQISDILNILQENDTTHIKKDNANHDENKLENYYGNRDYEIVDTDEGEIVYWEITNEDFELGLKMAEEQMRADGVDYENDMFWNKIKNDLAFKNKTIQKLKEKFDKQIHYHKENNKGKH